MLALIGKDFGKIVNSAVIMIVIVVFFWAIQFERVFSLAISTALIPFLTVLALCDIEVSELKDNGYQFLGSLPLKPAWIVLSKFALILVLIVILALVNILAASFLYKDYLTAQLYQTVTIYLTSLAIALAGADLAAMFKWGFLKVNTFALGIVVGTCSALNFLAFSEEKILERISSLSPEVGLILMAVSLLLYFLMLFLSIKLVERGPREKKRNLTWAESNS